MMPAGRNHQPAMNHARAPLRRESLLPLRREEGGEEGGEGAATESSGMAEGMASSGSVTRGQERLTSAVAG